MKISVARKKTSKQWRTMELPWEAFLSKIAEPLRTGETAREYKEFKKAERDAVKEAAGGFVGGTLTGTQRKTEFVKDRWIITLDADNASPGAWSRATMLNDFRLACYSTHSHTRSNPRLRWIIPVDRPMTPDEYPAVARRVASWLDIESMDPTTYEVARLMYWPTCSLDGVYEFHQQDGPVLKVQDVLATYGEGPAWEDSTLWPVAEAEKAIRRRQARRAGEPTEKPGLVGLFCRTWDVYGVLDQFLSDVYEPTQLEDRFSYRGGSTTGGAVVYNNGSFLYSNHATDPAAGASVNAYDLVRIHRFGDLDLDLDEDTPVNKLPSSIAMAKWAAELPELKRQLVVEKNQAAKQEFEDLEGMDLGGPTEPAVKKKPKKLRLPDPDAWTEDLDVNPKTGDAEPSQHNAFLILTNDPMLSGAMGYDEFSGTVKLLKDVPWRPKGSVNKKGRGEPWTDRDDAGVRGYLQHRWGFRSDKDLQSALELVFFQNAFHPVREYLSGLTWDGKPRVETLLIDYFGAEDCTYTRAIARKWMIGAVARVLDPGCKFDYILIACGAQGVGKSSFASILAKGWFQDSVINMTSKDGYDALHGAWIIELSELASLKRADLESVKAFVSKSEDTYRQAYARRTDTFSRQCVFFGSTNEQEFLRDRTGERRYWPFNASGRPVDQEELRRNVDQLWAEALELYRKKKEPLWLTGREETEGWRDMVRLHSVQDELDGQLTEFLDTPLPKNWYHLTPEERRAYFLGLDPACDLEDHPLRRDRVCLSEIRVEMCGEDRLRGGNDLLSRRLANLMNNRVGWIKKKTKARVPYYGPQWVYERKVRENDQK